MSISYGIDSTHNLIISNYYGIINIKNLSMHLEKLINDSTIEDRFFEIINTEDVKSIDLNHSEIKSTSNLWERYFIKGCDGLFVYVPSLVAYPFVKMLDGYLYTVLNEKFDFFNYYRSKESLIEILMKYVNLPEDFLI